MAAKSRAKSAAAKSKEATPAAEPTAPPAILAAPTSPRAAAEPAAAPRRGRRARDPAPKDEAEASGDRQFVVALARGLEVLGAFRPGDRALGNQEIAERTRLPKPTVSRLTHTLTELGYLTYSARLSNYELGPCALALGYAAFSNLDVRRIARPMMQELANHANLNVGLGLRDRLMMLHVETCEGQGLVGLRLFPGSRMPIATTAMGQAYLSAVPEGERAAILDEVRRQHGDEWPAIRRGIERARAEIETRGFCLSIGDWHKDINGAGAVVRMPDGRGVYALSLGGPAYLATEVQMAEEYGPMLADISHRIVAQLGG